MIFKLIGFWKVKQPDNGENDHFTTLTHKFIYNEQNIVFAEVPVTNQAKFNCVKYEHLSFPVFDILFVFLYRHHF